MYTNRESSTINQMLKREYANIKFIIIITFISVIVILNEGT